MMRTQTNPLEEYFLSNPGRQFDKWMYYFDIYDGHLSQFRGGNVTIVEFGVRHGGSMQMWKKYFGRKSRIIGIDIDPRCLTTAENGADVVLRDQDDRVFLNTLQGRLGGSGYKRPATFIEYAKDVIDQQKRLVSGR
jgi:cephalosporin hydroxylase